MPTSEPEDTTKAVPWTIQTLMELATDYWKSAALSAAVNLRLFEELERSPADCRDLAARMGTSPRHTEVFVNALVGLGLLEKEDGTYRVEPSAARFLTLSSPHSLLDALRFNVALYPMWGQLADYLREGRPVVPPAAHLGEQPDRTRAFVLAMHSRALAMAEPVISALDLQSSRSLLDLGAGPGTFSRLLAERYPDLSVTLFDLPPILDVARELTRQHPVEDRISFHPGDYRNDDLPVGFDAVLYCGSIHQESPSSAQTVIERIIRALKPGGTAWIVDMMLDADATHPCFSALFSITMILTSPHGQVHREEDIRSWLQKAGFLNLECRCPINSPYRVICGRKRTSPSETIL